MTDYVRRGGGGRVKECLRWRFKTMELSHTCATLGLDSLNRFQPRQQEHTKKKKNAINYFEAAPVFAD